MAEETFNPKIDFPKMEREIMEYWEKEKIFQELRNKNEKNEIFSFLEGPPTANGHPHFGHALTRATKDVVLRFNAMNGKNIFPWIGGWDCHGLPVELEVEKMLKINSKKEIEKYGIKEFNALCKESVFKYKKEWEEMTKRIGFWIDLENAYVTMSNSYIESVWWALSKIWNMGLLEKSFKIVPYCPRCGTPLSSHEVAQGYKETEDPSIYVKFKVKDEDAYFLVWTTTPWTLPSNLFLAVNENIDYVLVNYNNEKYYLSNEVSKKLMPDAEIVKILKGKDLLNKRYERIIDAIPYDGNVFYVVSGDFVSIDEGTGIVHIAPAFGSDDFEIARRLNVKILNPVDREGKFTDGPWKGKFVKEADKEIISYLKKENKLFKSERIKHVYPFCWRCGTPLLYYPLDTWYIKVSNIREKLIENNEKINWIPDHLKHGRFGNFLLEAKDWALSRDRYWGTPLPVWKCKNGHTFVPSSFKELFQHSEKVPDDFEPHRPWVDELVVKCPVCNEKMERENFVIDGWFDSGSAPFAQFHYPFENKDKFEKFYPVEFITEAIDQTRGWFYTLHVVNSLINNSNSYKNVLTLGFVLNERGEKMSKSKGDAVDPMPIMDNLGADALRVYIFSLPPWKDRRVSSTLIKEYRSRTIETLWNSYVFFKNNAKLDNFHYDEGEITESLDKWIISKLNSTIKCVRNYMEKLEINRAMECNEKFINDLSNWYIRRSRRRFWEEKLTQEKMSGYRTMYIVFRDFSKILAPFAPFISEYIFRNLTGEKSVHLQDYPKENESLIDLSLENDMQSLINVVELGRRARQVANIKTRQPIEKIYVITKDEKLKNVLEEHKDIIIEELNVKEVFIENDINKFVKVSIKLDPKVVGPIFKNEIKGYSEYLMSLDPLELRNRIKESGTLKILDAEIPSNGIIFTEEPIDDLELAKDNDLYVLITKKIDKNLLLEGLARELVRRIQIMRKELDLAYADRIELKIESIDPDIELVLKNNKDYIEKETLSIFNEDLNEGYSKEWDIQDRVVKITIRVLK
ncbi:MAG: isoleucine--tRNA ligase [Thermoplasmata archaeon]|nr:isoleucine--tRNA ligase [Thermoplasmata archaeon]